MASEGITINGRYRLDKKIGEGGFAQVYLANDLVLARMVAVKIMDEAYAGNDEFLSRFHAEARSVAVLDHPNILTVFDFGLMDNTAFLVMPYVAGGPFSARMRAGRLTLDEVAFYLEQIAAALDYAHKNGLVHRDVKPQNILVRTDGRAVLTDFGLAKLLEDANVEARTGILGTVYYMAPEQFRGLVSAASDQYALGVLLYQMIAEVLPFTGSTRDVLTGHMQRNVPPLSTQATMQNVRPEVVARLDQVISRVLSKQPNTRFANCTALYNAYRVAVQSNIGVVVPIVEKTELPMPIKPLVEERTELYQKPVAQTPPVQPVIRPPIASPPQTTPAQNYAPAQNNPTVLAPPPRLPNNNPPPNVPPTYIAPVQPANGYNAPSQPPAPPVLVQSARLSVRTDPDQHINLSFELNGEILKLGRENHNDLHLPLATVSRHHATLYRVGTVGPGMKYRIVDNKSLNQLFYRGRPITEKVLEDGDILEIGMRGFGEYVVFLTYSAPVFSTNNPDGAGLVNPNPPRPYR